MSRVKRSWPRPTVNTGIERAFEAGQRFVERGVGGVGAVGDHHEPGAAAGPTAHRRARSERIAELRRRAVVACSSAADPSRPADEENLKNRRTKRSRSALSSARVGTASSRCTNWLRGWPSRSAISMLRESSIRTPRKFCWRNRGLQDERRPDQAEQAARPPARAADPMSTAFVARRAFARDRSVRQQHAGRDRRRQQQDEQQSAGMTPSTKSPC